ncbi:MAG: ferritin family protein [Clostridia bacterium]|nr:ferritin family protein [Clostridia bacterium]MDR3643695.1 ferritin family protein [Clostridia bacterium]
MDKGIIRGAVAGIGGMKKEPQKPAYTAPTYTAPVQQQAAPAPAQKPAYTAPVQQPVAPAPAQKPAYTASVQQPVAPAPAQKPAYTAPVQQTAPPAPAQKPAYTAPMQQPAASMPSPQFTYTAPVYTESAQKPAYAAPVQQPVYMAPMQQAYTAPVQKAAYDPMQMQPSYSPAPDMPAYKTGYDMPQYTAGIDMQAYPAKMQQPAYTMPMQQTMNDPCDLYGNAYDPTQTQAAEYNQCPPAVAAENVLPASACYGSDSAKYACDIMNFINDECHDSFYYAMLACRAPTAAAQRLCCYLSREERRHAKKWQAAYFVITGQKYMPNRSALGPICPPRSFSEALRERYIAEINGAAEYRGFAEQCTDPCLKKLAEDMAEEEQQHAELILDLLQCM